MKKYLKLISIFIFIIMIAFLSANSLLAAENFGGLKEAAGRAGYAEPQAPEIVVGQIIRYVLAFIGVIFLILVIYGGFMWMTAAGNEEKIRKAKVLITSAVIGLVIILGAEAITAYILTKLLSTTGLF